MDNNMNSNVNNEDTTVMNQENNPQAENTQDPTADEPQKKSSNGKRVAATVAAGAAGVAAGAGAMYGASEIFGKEDEEVVDEEEGAQEEAAQQATPAAQPVAAQPQHEETPQVKDPEEPSNEGLGHIPEQGPTTVPVSNTSSGEIHVTGSQEFQTANGQTGEAIYLSDGNTNASLIDTDGDNEVNILAVDLNHDNEIQVNEMIDVSDRHIRMDGQESQTEPQTTQTSGPTNEVQVLGVYQDQGDEGQTIEYAVMTNGQEMAVVGDFDGDRYADSIWVDHNGNQQAEEGEVYDISSEQVHMSTYENAYAQQQMQEQQIQQDSYTYNADNDLPDYTNDADPSMA